MTDEEALLLEEYLYKNYEAEDVEKILLDSPLTGPNGLRKWLGEVDKEYFGRAYFPDYFEDETPEFHFELDKMITEYELNHDKYRGMILAAPRGHAKSVRITFLDNIQCIVYKKKKFIVIISDSDTQAESITNDIRMEIEQNEALREDFGNLVGEDYGLKWTAGDFTVAFPSQKQSKQAKKPKPGHTCRVVARGTGAGMRGLKNRSARPDRVCLDDIENDKLVLTMEQRNKTWAWLMGAVIPMLHPKHGSFIFVGTVLHYDSVLSKLLAQPEVYLTKKYQAIKENGTSLWPARFPLKRLNQIKTQIGSLKFGQEYQNDPMDKDTMIFRPEWYKWYTRSQIHFDTKKEVWMFEDEPMKIYQGVDPAISEKETADDFVIFTIGVTPTYKIICLDIYAVHIGFTEQIEAVVRKYQEWLPERVGIETNAYQMALKTTVIKAALIPVKQLNHNNNKFVRIENMSPFFENSQVFLRAAMNDEPGFNDPVRLPNIRIHEKFKRFYEQIVTFGPKCTRDDILDALESAISLAKAKVLPNEFWK